MPSDDSISTSLIEGDPLTSDEFLRRWEEMPDLKRAELIDGIVQIGAPVSFAHGDYEMYLGGWLGSLCGGDARLPAQQGVDVAHGRPSGPAA